MACKPITEERLGMLHWLRGLLGPQGDVKARLISISVPVVPGQPKVKDMPTKKTNPDLNKLDRVVAEARLNQEERERGYRERALKMYPWVCGRCAREFTLKNVRELTVHHRDHNHDNNPADGSNWELLCVYCHDNEHQRYLTAELTGKDKAGARQDANTTFKAFAGLGDLLKRQN
jgi:hypothetical protein